MNTVVALGFDDASTQLLAHELRGVARKFAPHITVKGRFVCEGRSNADLCQVLKKVFGTLVYERYRLSKPIKIAQNVAWREIVEPTKEAYLRDLHVRVNRIVREAGLLASDRTPEEFQMEGYRPHVTIGWTHPGICIPILEFSAEEVEVTCKSLELYLYRDTPFNSAVTRVKVKEFT
jgi:2'-5' RNA ligase